MTDKKISDLASGSAPAGTELLEVDQSATSVSLTAKQIANTADAWQPVDADLTTIAGLTATTDNMIQSVSSAWASRTPTQVKTALGLTIGTNVQAFDQDLTDIAAVTRNRGDLIVGGASAWTDLAIGASPKFLGTDGTDPIWRNGTRVVSLDTGGTYNMTGSALTIATHTVPGALLAVGDLLSLEIAFYYLNNTTVNQGPVLTIDFGSTAGFFSATNSALATNANPRQMFLRSTFIATAVGNPATVSSSTLYQMGNVATATTASNIPAAANDQFGTNVDSAQDSGSNITIAVKMNGANTATHQVITRASVLVHTPKW